LFVLALAIERTLFAGASFWGMTFVIVMRLYSLQNFPAVIVPADFASWWRVVQNFMLRMSEFKYEVLFLRARHFPRNPPE
jgi:hypothetical protein